MVKHISSRSSSYSEKSPQFFKIYIPQHYSQRLRIPPAFIKYFKGVRLSKTILKTSRSKTSWCIDVNKLDKYFFFEKGWPEFVSDNSLEFGDFLVFCYTGDSEFYVPIFGENNCPKEFPLTNTRNNDKRQPVLQGTPTGEHTKSDEKMCVDSPVEIGTARMPIRENIGILRSTTACQFGSKMPFFETVLKPSYVNSGLNYIPVDFVKSYMSSHRKTARLKHFNKSWVVKLIRQGKSLIFSCGWGKFIADNTLHVGDVCSFELIRRNHYAFNVAILRSNGTPNKAQATKTTHPSSSREEGGKSKERRGRNKREEGSKRTVDVNIEDTPSKYISKHPFFQITLTPTYVTRSFLNIPLSFRNNYMNKRRTTARLQHSNKWWEVNLKGYGSRAFRFCGGWNKFAKENSLQVGDVCSFELINMENYVIKVSIARSVNFNGNPSKA